jgi:hypothetical protein
MITLAGTARVICNLSVPRSVTFAAVEAGVGLGQRFLARFQAGAPANMSPRLASHTLRKIAHE